MQERETQSAPSVRPRAGCFRHLFRALSGIGLTAVAALAILYFTRDRWTPAVATWAAEHFAETSLEIEAVEWRGLSGIELHRVHVAPLGNGSVLRDARIDSVRIDSLRLGFDLWKLAREGLTGMRAVEADRVRALADLSLESQSKPSAQSSGIPAGWPRGLPSIHVSDLDLEVRAPGSRTVALSHAVFRFEPRDDEAAIALTSYRLDYRDPERSIARPLALNATWRPGELEVTRLEVDPRFQVDRLSLDLARLAQGEIAADAAGRAFGGEHEIHIVLAQAQSILSARVRSRSLALSDALASLLPDPPAGLAARVDLDLDLTFPLAAPLDARGRMHLDALDVRFAGHSLDWLRADLSADANGLRGNEIFLLQGANLARISDLFVPRDVRDLCQLRQRLTCAVEAEIEDVPALLAEVGETGVELRPHRGSLKGWIANQALELEGGEFLTTGGRLTIERGHIPLAPEWRDIVADPELALRMHALFDDVAPLAAILGWPRAEGRLEAAVGVLGGDQGLHGWADVQAEELRVADQVLGSVAAHCDLARGRVDVEHMQVVGPDASLDVRGRYVIHQGRLENVHARGWLRDASVLRLESIPRGGLEVDADLAGTWPEIDGRLFARADALETQKLGELRVEIAARSTRGRIDVDDLTVESRYGHLRAQGAAGTLAELTAGGGTMCFRIDALEWSDGSPHVSPHLSLVEPVDVELAPGGVYVRGVELAGSTGTVRAALALDSAHGSVQTSLQDFDPMPWIARFTTEDVRCKRIDLDLDASWSAADVRARAKGRAEMLRIGASSPAADVELDGTLEEKRVSLRRLSVSAVLVPPAAQPGEAPAAAIREAPLVISGEFPLDLRGSDLLPDGPIRAQGAIELHDLQRIASAFGSGSSKVAGRLRADLDLNGTWSEPRGKIDFSASDLAWTPSPGQNAPVVNDSAQAAGSTERTFGPCSIECELDIDRDLSIKRLDLDLSSGVRADCSGRVRGPFDLRDALLGKSGAWRDSPLELAVEVETQNLSLLTVMIPSLRRLGGKLQGSVSVKGTFAHPSFSGQLELADGEVRTASALPSLNGLKAKLTLDGERVRLEGLNGEMGGAPFSLSGTLSPFGPKPAIDLQLTGEHLLLYRASGVRVRAGAKLEITGPLSALAIRGDLLLDDSRFTQDFDFLSVFGTKNPSPPLFSRPLFELPPPFATATFDVKIGSKSPFVLQNNVMKGGVRLDLRLVGTGALPILRGSILIDPTRISLPSGKITARSGTVEFLPSAPFAPRLDALADARLQGYDIKIHLSGTIEEPVVELSSVPPLPHEDLLLLVLTGTLPRADQKSPTGIQAAQQVAVYLANDVISSWFKSSGSGPDEDLLEVQTGRDVTETGAETATARLRVWKGIFSDNSSLYVTGERDIYDRYNFGVRLLFRFP